MPGPTLSLRAFSTSRSVNSSATSASTNTRLTARHAWPQLKKRPTDAALAAPARSASLSTMNGSEPPSSSVSRLAPLAASSITRSPTGVEPVKPILRTSGCLTSASPTTEPGPVTTLKTPLGRPASCSSSAIRSVVSGVVSAGLATIVLPATSAGASLFASSVVGKFHGTIAPTTPSGRLVTSP